MKIKEGGVMDMQKEREAFEKLPAVAELIKTNNVWWSDVHGDYFGSDHELDCWIDGAWAVWQAKAQAVLEWISVKDNLPPANILVLGMSQTRSNIFNVYNVMALDEFEEAEVTHWMPLSDAPQEPDND